MSTNETDTTTAEPQPAAENLNRKQPFPRGFLETISTGWADRPEQTPPLRAQAPHAAARRDALSAAFPGKRLFRLRSGERLIWL